MPEFPIGQVATIPALQVEAVLQTRKIANATSRICQLRDTWQALKWIAEEWGDDYSAEMFRAAAAAVKQELLYNMGIIASGVPAMLELVQRAEAQLDASIAAARGKGSA